VWVKQLISDVSDTMASGNDISTFVRSWLHYDNMASSFYKQANRARQLKEDFEKKILELLRVKRMENAIIQINGGRLSVTEERNPKTLSLIRIEELLHGYYAQRGGHDETTEIMNYIRANRGIDVNKRLKKTGISNLPPLAAPGQ